MDDLVSRVVGSALCNVLTSREDGIGVAYMGELYPEDLERLVVSTDPRQLQAWRRTGQEPYAALSYARSLREDLPVHLVGTNPSAAQDDED